MSERTAEPIRFTSDNTATVCPEILAGIVEANRGLAPPYGLDRWTARIDDAVGELFGTAVRTFMVPTGTAANALALGTLAPPYSIIFAHEDSHVVREEFGAPELFSGGARVVPVAGADGKITPDTLRAALDAAPASMTPAALSLTQATDLGTVYRSGEITALSRLAHARGLKVHMDGARLANAIVFLRCHPGDITWRAGVDVLSFGLTKNGGLATEAVVFFDRSLVADFELRRRRGGHLLSKSRFCSAQLLAYLETGVWRSNAERTNRLAAELARDLAIPPLHPVEANEVFVRLGADRKARLRASGFEFDDWGSDEGGQARFVISWDQPEGDIRALASAVATICARGVA